MNRKEKQGSFAVEVPDDVARGRPVNYVNVQVANGNVILDLGFITPFREGQEEPEAILVFRGGTNVAYIRVIHAVLTGLLQQIDQRAGGGGSIPPLAGGGVAN